MVCARVRERWEEERGRGWGGGGRWGGEGEEGRRVGLDMKVGVESERVQDVLMIKNAISKVSGFREGHLAHDGVVVLRKRRRNRAVLSASITLEPESLGGRID